MRSIEAHIFWETVKAVRTPLPSALLTQHHLDVLAAAPNASCHKDVWDVLWEMLGEHPGLLAKS